MNTQSNILLEICRRKLAFLQDHFSFIVVEETHKDGSMIFRMERPGIGVVVEFEPHIVYPRLFVYPTSNPRKRIELNSILKVRAPQFVYPTQATDAFLTEMVRSVLAGKRMKGNKYPEDISFEKVLSKYASGLREALADVLDGDFSKVDFMLKEYGKL